MGQYGISVYSDSVLLRVLMLDPDSSSVKWIASQVASLYGLKPQNTSEEVHMLAINLLERTVATKKVAAQPCRLPC